MCWSWDGGGAGDQCESLGFQIHKKGKLKMAAVSSLAPPVVFEHLSQLSIVLASWNSQKEPTERIGLNSQLVADTG